MKVKRILSIILCVCFCSVGCTGCSDSDEKKKADFSGISAVCQLATLKCYYHNVATAEQDANDGPLGSLFNRGYKKIWVEYSGIVELGIDVNEVRISEPDEDGVVKVTIPDAKITDVDLDENSMSRPLIDKGFLTSITKEEETDALAAAQENMEKTAKENTSMLVQAKQRAKSIIQGYIKNVGELMGENYTVQWEDVE